MSHSSNNASTTHTKGKMGVRVLATNEHCSIALPQAHEYY
jgi:hypothetical protein